MRLVVVDTSAIQRYIFRSNRLRENIGASHLVAQATGRWALETVQSFPSHNVVHAARGVLLAPAASDAREIEVLYAGGGNLVAIFRDDNLGAFTCRLSRRVLQDAPNLQIEVASIPLATGQPLATALDDLFRALARQKRSRALSAPLLGLSVTAACQSTGLPAVGRTDPIGDDRGYLASPEILAKLDAVRPAGQPGDADRRLRDFLPPPEEYDYPSDFEELGGSHGEHGYIAVVHADGNSMGQRLRAIGEDTALRADDRAYVGALRAFSDGVQAAAQAALQTTLRKLAAAIERDRDGDRRPSKVGLHLSIARGSGRRWLPFRPLVFGGDDLTFVCDGRLGLSLAAEYLEQFEVETAARPACHGAITASAGVAIVKSHYPFARAYALAGELTDSAKQYRRSHSRLAGSTLDWHFALSGLAGSIEEIRRREYCSAHGSLAARPVTLGANPIADQSDLTWARVRGGIDEFQTERWLDRRNKLKDLRDRLREGPDAVAAFRAQYGLPLLPDLRLDLGEESRRTGWLGKRCLYFDAIELADWFIPL